jgi:Raf kinase inhibitor-like YbhB/YbcL family protein
VGARTVGTVLLLALAAAGCAGAGGRGGAAPSAAVTAPMVITVTSPAFPDGHPIPTRYTCAGANSSPALAWRGVPEGAKAIALVVDDPDAPNGTFVHWVALDLSPTTTGVAAHSLPAGAVQARNSAGHASYTGPCPPSGTHHYRFTVYALRARTGLSTGAPTDSALRAVRRLAIAQGRLVGTYSRH